MLPIKVTSQDPQILHHVCRRQTNILVCFHVQVLWHWPCLFYTDYSDSDTRVSLTRSGVYTYTSIYTSTHLGCSIAHLPPTMISKWLGVRNDEEADSTPLTHYCRVAGIMIIYARFLFPMIISQAFNEVYPKPPLPMNALCVGENLGEKFIRGGVLSCVLYGSRPCTQPTCYTRLVLR